ncbi:A/G-specific adenine glycosylase [candidate division KSB1 bacterium]|nr:A/G-specific adenine glycosylase [candidate division KSB1 bacterium]
MKKKSHQNISGTDSLGGLSARLRSILQQKILRWYLASHRQLPWRKTRAPYAIWVSEVMLQQTQTVKVLQYYEAFLKRFPTLAALAQAQLDDVLKAWEGMGYYARARNLHRAAQQILKVHGGKFPETYEQLLEIAGIGPYTAAAVASIAFNQNRAVLDGNVERVLSRIFLVHLPPKNPSAKKLFHKIAADFLLHGQARDWNQALMELGALICTPTRPKCESCPAQRHCRAYNEMDHPDRLPVRVRKPPRPHYNLAVGLIWKGARLLIDQRKENALLGGLWEFPGGKTEAHETHAEALRREIREGLAVEVEVGDFFMTVEHGFTHFSITLHVYHCRFITGTPRAIGCQKWQWVLPEELDQFAFPTANRKIIAALKQSV